MRKCFAAFSLPDEVADHLAAALPGEFPADARPVHRDQWHITMAFYGEDDADRRLAWLTEQTQGHQAPTLRLTGTGTFPGVTWIGVAGDLDTLATAVAAENDYRAHVAHVTIAWMPRPREWDLDLPEYSGPEWTAPELVLYSSEQGRYTRVGGVRLAVNPTC